MSELSQLDEAMMDEIGMRVMHKRRLRKWAQSRSPEPPMVSRRATSHRGDGTSPTSPTSGGRWQLVNARTVFDMSKRLGRSGQVYVGKYKCPLRRITVPCAVKVTQRTSVVKDQREVDVLVKSNKHPNVVDILDRHDPST